jgi:hypothetical protein
MSWNRQEVDRFDSNTKKALRAARKISLRHSFPTGYLPIETLVGSIIDLDPEVNKQSKLVGLSSNFFHEATPHNLYLFSYLDHPALLLARVAEMHGDTQPDILRPIHIMNYVLRSDHQGIQGVLGLRVYRRGMIQPQTILDAFTPMQDHKLKIAA